MDLKGGKGNRVDITFDSQDEHYRLRNMLVPHMNLMERFKYIFGDCIDPHAAVLRTHVSVEALPKVQDSIDRRAAELVPQVMGRDIFGACEELEIMLGASRTIGAFLKQAR